MRLSGQSIIEYIVILMIVAIISMAFARNFLYNERGEFRLFSGYVESAQRGMR